MIKKYLHIFSHMTFYQKLAMVAALVILSLDGSFIFFTMDQSRGDAKPVGSSATRIASGHQKIVSVGEKQRTAKSANTGALAKAAAVRAWSKRALLPAGQKIAFLTFDDGPSCYTPGVLKILTREKVKATFFVAFMGSDTRTKRNWVRMEQTTGQTIGVHSWTHKYSYIYASERNFMADFHKMRSILTEITGTEPRLFRFPGGVSNTVSLRVHGKKPIIPALLVDLAQAGMTPFDWTAGGEDAQIPRPASPRQFAAEIISNVGRQEHPIILMHDTDRISEEAVPYVIAQLRAEGYRFAVLNPDMRPIMGEPISTYSSPHKNK